MIAGAAAPLIAINVIAFGPGPGCNSPAELSDSCDYASPERWYMPSSAAFDLGLVNGNLSMCEAACCRHPNCTSFARLNGIIIRDGDVSDCHLKSGSDPQARDYGVYYTWQR